MKKTKQNKQKKQKQKQTKTIQNKRKEKNKKQTHPSCTYVDIYDIFYFEKSCRWWLELGAYTEGCGVPPPPTKKKISLKKREKRKGKNKKINQNDHNAVYKWSKLTYE